MKILRLEYINDPNTGPWRIDEADEFNLMLFGERPNYGAYAADRVARKQHVKEPSDHPSPLKDKPLAKALGDLRPGGAYFGFASPDQYADWFQTPEVRRAVLGDRIHLVCYEVPDDKVMVGSSQVVFKMGDVIAKHPLDNKYAVYLST